MPDNILDDLPDFLVNPLPCVPDGFAKYGVGLHRRKLLQDGRSVFVVPMAYGKWRINIGFFGSPYVDNNW